MKRFNGLFMKNNKGFTLVDTLMAMAVIAIAIFVFAPIFAYSFKQITDSGIWQNVIIQQRAYIENQQAKRDEILADTGKHWVGVTLNLYDAGKNVVDVDIQGKTIEDALGDKTHIKSFITNIYDDDPLFPDIIVSPQSIYYGEDIRDKTFVLYGFDLPLVTNAAEQITIKNKNNLDCKSSFKLTYDMMTNSVKLKVESSAGVDFYKQAPFTIQYRDYIAKIRVLLPSITAVTDSGKFITGYFKDGDIRFSKVVDSIPSITGKAEEIVYNFQKREYVVVGEKNMCRVFEVEDNEPVWNKKDTDQPAQNNNYSVAVDWNDNYMIGSSYNATVDNHEVAVFLSVYQLDANNKYALKQVYKANAGDSEQTIRSIEANRFDFIRSSIFVSAYDNENIKILTESFSENYVFAFGHYGITGIDDTNYYDILYAAKSYDVISDEEVWVDISSKEPNMPSNPPEPPDATYIPIKITGAASGIGRYNKSDGGYTEYSVLAVCTSEGKVYGFAPAASNADPVETGNTDWKLLADSEAASLKPFKSIVYGNDRFVAVGSGSQNVYIGILTANTEEEKKFETNINWQSKNIDGVNFEEIEYIHGKFYAVGSLGGKGVIYSSFDGSTWDKVYTLSNCTITSIAGE